MCAEYKVKTKVQTIQDELGHSVLNIAPRAEWDERIKMSMSAPVLGVKDGEIKLNELTFPVNPFPNARLSQLQSNKTGEQVAETDDQIVRITDIPLWKTSFQKYPCVVPMTSFLEPAYWGDHAGEVIEFTDPKRGMLFVPAILIKPRVPATGKLDGFSLLTHTASDQMLDYHHRLLVLLTPKKAVEYLMLGAVSPEERYDFLLANRYVPKFETVTDRKMAKGWDKRVGKHVAALEDERKYTAALEREGARG